jgi:protein phosphatase
MIFNCLRRRAPRVAPVHPEEPLEVIGHMLTDTGPARESNEDCAAYAIPRPPDPRSEIGMLALVADGMGGHAAGEVASAMAADIILRTYYATPGGDRHGALRQAFQDANRRIHAVAAADPACRGMGTTCTALALLGRRAYVAHVGDSRLYLARGGRIRQLTTDHSLVMELVRAGHINRQQARCRSDRNIILRALGTRPDIDVELWQAPIAVQPGDRFLLCSDGLTDLVPDAEIGRALHALAPAEACRSLLGQAINAGGHDNVTVGVFIAEAPGRSASARDTRTHGLVGVTK